MKTKFTKEYIMIHRGCYEEEQVERIKCINNKVITLKQLFRDLPIKDFNWFLVKKCKLTIRQKQFFALNCAEHTAYIYNNKYPEDSRVSECIKYTKLYLNNKCEAGDLMEKRNAASDAAYASDAAAYASAAAAAAAYASDAAASSASAYAYASAAAAADAYASDAAAYASDYKEAVWKFVFIVYLF